MKSWDERSDWMNVGRLRCSKVCSGRSFVGWFLDFCGLGNSSSSKSKDHWSQTSGFFNGEILQRSLVFGRINFSFHFLPVSFFIVRPSDSSVSCLVFLQDMQHVLKTKSWSIYGPGPWCWFRLPQLKRLKLCLKENQRRVWLRWFSSI